MILIVAAFTLCRIETIEPPPLPPHPCLLIGGYPDMIGGACVAVMLPDELNKAKCASSTTRQTLHSLIRGICSVCSQNAPRHSTKPMHALLLDTDTQNEEATLVGALLNFDHLMLVKSWWFSYLLYMLNSNYRFRSLERKTSTLTGAVPAGRRLAVAEGGREGAQLLHR